MRGRTRFLALLGLWLLTIMCYRSVWSAGILYEDPQTLLGATRPWPIWYQALPGRWLALWTFWGSSVRWWHLQALGWHLANGTLVYALARRLRATDRAALVSCGIFLLCPLQSESVAYLTSRSDLISAFGILLAGYGVSEFHIWWEWWPIVAGILIALAGKESGVVGFGLLPLVWWRCEQPRLIRWEWVGLLVLLLLPAVHSAQILTNPATWVGGDLAAYRGVQAVAAWRYLSMVAVPTGFSIDHDWSWVSQTIGEAWWMLGVGCLAVAIVVRREAPMLLWTMSWITISLLPRFVVHTSEYLNEHQYYLAMVGVAIGLGAVYDWGRRVA